jgi:hypothetical protein
VGILEIFNIIIMGVLAGLTKSNFLQGKLGSQERLIWETLYKRN